MTRERTVPTWRNGEKYYDIQDRPGTIEEKLDAMETAWNEDASRTQPFDRDGVEMRLRGDTGPPYEAFNGAEFDTVLEVKEFNQVLGQHKQDYADGESTFNPFPVTTFGLELPLGYYDKASMEALKPDTSITFEDAWVEAKQTIAANAQAQLDKEAAARTQAAREYYEGLGLWGKVKLLFKRRY